MEEELRFDEGDSFMSMLQSVESGEGLCFGDSAQMLCFGADHTLSFPLDASTCMASLSASTKGVSDGSRVRRTARSVAASGVRKPKKQEASDGGHGVIKLVRRREKLGDRILALQQLVSPFGKTDTASVLHEALGYIRFLHDQIQVLSTPYLQLQPTSAHLQGERKNDHALRSRGLCLVPVACTEGVAECNGADLWSSSMFNHHTNHH